MVDYRPIPDDRRETFYAYTGYAFDPESGPLEEFDPDDLPESAGLGAKRGLYDDGAPEAADPLCVCKHHWFDARVRGDVHPTPGLSAVASPPEHRRQGHVRRLLRESLREYRDRGARFSVLWPFKYAFYRAYGWDTCNRRLTYDLEPAALSFAIDADDGRGSYRRLEADDYADLEAAYGTHAADYGLSLVRDEDWWRTRVLSGREADPYVYGWERDGEVRGYLVYDVEGDWGDRTLRVHEWASVDREAHLAVLAFCATHESQIQTVRLRAPVDDPLPDLADEPDEIDCEREDGPMVRVVDVADALSALSYPDEVDERLVLGVSDPLVGWNDGAFVLEVADGAGTCEPARDDATADARVDVAALSQLAVGFRSASDLAWCGRLEADDGATAALERLFPPEPTYLRDGF